MALSRAGLLDTATPPLENMSRTENLSIEFKQLNPTTSLDRNEAENAATWPIFAYDDSSNKLDKMASRHLKSLHACQVTL